MINLGIAFNEKEKSEEKLEWTEEELVKRNKCPSMQKSPNTVPLELVPLVPLELNEPRTEEKKGGSNAILECMVRATSKIKPLILIFSSHLGVYTFFLEVIEHSWRNFILTIKWFEIIKLNSGKYV